MKVWECDRCKKIYKKNDNKLIKTFNNIILEDYSDYTAVYIKIFNQSLDIETDFYNLCDECFEKFYNWFKEKN